jgi:hypothetical protein
MQGCSCSNETQLCYVISGTFMIVLFLYRIVQGSSQDTNGRPHHPERTRTQHDETTTMDTDEADLKIQVDKHFLSQ